MRGEQSTYKQQAEQKIVDICHRWRSAEYRRKQAMREADFYIGLLTWIVEEDKDDCREAIAVYQAFIEKLDGGNHA